MITSRTQSIYMNQEINYLAAHRKFRKIWRMLERKEGGIFKKRNCVEIFFPRTNLIKKTSCMLEDFYTNSKFCPIYLGQSLHFLQDSEKSRMASHQTETHSDEFSTQEKKSKKIVSLRFKESTKSWAENFNKLTPREHWLIARTWSNTTACFKFRQV